MHSTVYGLLTTGSVFVCFYLKAKNSIIVSEIIDVEQYVTKQVCHMVTSDFSHNRVVNHYFTVRYQYLLSLSEYTTRSQVWST